MFFEPGPGNDTSCVKIFSNYVDNRTNTHNKHTEYQLLRIVADDFKIQHMAQRLPISVFRNFNKSNPNFLKIFITLFFFNTSLEAPAYGIEIWLKTKISKDAFTSSEKDVGAPLKALPAQI